MARPNLHEVARIAGVSVSSASRALNGASASPSMVERVRAAAKQLGYLPDATARSLQRGGVRQVVFAVDDVGNPNYIEMLRAIERRISLTDIRLIISTTGSGASDTVELVNRLNAGGADGLIISPLRISPNLIEAINNSSVPIVVVGSLGNSDAVDMVRVDSALAVRAAVEHLVSIGRTRLAFINGPLDTNPGRTRSRGYTDALQEFASEVTDVGQIVATDFTVAAGLGATTDFLRSTKSIPDAIVAANDLIAIGAISAVMRQGLRVPQDIAVTGIDDTEIASIYNPSLTSVSLQSGRRGHLAAELLLERFQLPSRPPRVESVSPELIVRASTIGSTN